MAFFGLSIHLLGGRFDDGNNFVQDEDSDDYYDTNFNEYPNVEIIGVAILAAVRNSIGDLQTPSYDQWMIAPDELGKKNKQSQTMIALIWIYYIMFIFVQVILALNFLVAIVSQSYEAIMEKQLETIIFSFSELNLESMQESNPDSEKDVQILAM